MIYDAMMSPLETMRMLGRHRLSFFFGAMTVLESLQNQSSHMTDWT